MRRGSKLFRRRITQALTKYLIRDNDGKFDPRFARVATTSGIKVLRTPYRTPRANAK